MSRGEGFLQVMVVAVAAVLVTEWIHYRLGDPALFGYLTRRSERPAVDDGTADDTVTESEVESYLAVLESMQVDHDLGIEDAVASRHLPLERFRDVEQRVQRNPSLVERVRDRLRERAEALWRERGEPLETASRPKPAHPVH